MSTTSDLLFEIGCEELPASFVERALEALPELATKKLGELRLAFEGVRAIGTPRRLSLLVTGLSREQPNLEEEVVGPPARAAFKDGQPTKAAEAFAVKLGCAVADLKLQPTPKGEYLVGTRREAGRPATELLPGALAQIAAAIPFRKSMRWGAGETAFGRPIQWIVALFGEEVVGLSFAGVESGRHTLGHRFLAPAPIALASATGYVEALRAAHVLADPAERSRVMQERLVQAATEAGGALIEDDFLVGENLSLVEEPHVVCGGFEPEFLELPEQVILAVAKGHQRYFGIRGKDQKLLPRYLAVVNTAENPAAIRLGNDRVMRARLADARFFWRTDKAIPLVDRRAKLSGIVFQKRLGTVLAKAERIEKLAKELGLLLALPEATIGAAASGAHLAKCDLVSLMVGEFPELEGDMGTAYAITQGTAPEVAAVIREHYQPRGAGDSTAPSDAGALVAIADRLDTLVGCFAIGLVPTGAADPYGLRRATLGILRTILDRGFDLRLSQAFAAAYDGYAGTALDVAKADLVAKLGEFATERLRNLLAGELPADACAAAIAVAADRPLDAKARATAIAKLDAETRAKVGEVFKRATNIAESAPEGAPSRPSFDGVHASETALFDGYVKLADELGGKAKAGDYAGAFAAIGGFAPLLSQYFVDVFVMAEDLAVRAERLKLMRAISGTCSSLAKLELLGG
jgi:glycyl-tRNA synthetase beta chain